MLFVMSGLMMTSCNKYLDINDSPNSSEATDPDYLFTYASAAWCGQRAGGDLFLPMSFLGQTLATGGNSGWGIGEDAYDISPYSTGNMWRNYYATAGNNLQSTINIAENAEIPNLNGAAQAKILFAALLYECSVVYGDIPYSQGWNPDYTAPKFDSQQDVFNSLIDLLDNALAQMDLTNSLSISSGDLFYGGDMAMWQKAANSMKLKIYMTMVDADPSVAGNIATLISDASTLITDPSENLAFPFEDVGGKQNPKNRLFVKYAGGTNPWVFANANVLDVMKAQADPRIPFWFDIADGYTDYYGLETSDEATDSSSVISMSGLWYAEAPEIILSSQEILFFMAEAKARGLGGAVDLAGADADYKAALTQACTLFGVDAADADAFASSIPALTSSATPVDDIHLQQWIDLMDRGVDAFTQWRRSGPEGSEVPALSVPQYAPANGLIRRYEYPDIELTANPNAPARKYYYEKMWFDQ